ncbi:MAG: hypothetical protein QXD43_02665 [Candidatus Aenigmatarchaeota archaeon]
MKKFNFEISRKNFELLLKEYFDFKKVNINTILNLQGYTEWKRKMNQLKKRMKTYLNLFKNKRTTETDKFFYSLEELPILGKEYWFIYLVDKNIDKKFQFVLTAGRAANPVKVNSTKLSVKNKDSLSEIKTATVCWFYDNSKKVIFDELTSLKIIEDEKNKLLFTNKDSNILIQGRYPHISIQIFKDNKTIAEFNFSESKSNFKYDMVELLRNSMVKNFGAIWLNYYLNYKGYIFDTKTEGNAYLQKVVAITPLAPWNWARIYFDNDIIFDLFMIKPIGDNLDIKYQSAYVEFNNKRYELENINLIGYGKRGEKNWLIYSKDFYIVLKTYSFMPFVLEDKTKFYYDEYLVEVVDAQIYDKKLKNIKFSNKGIGIVEDAYGYLL